MKRTSLIATAALGTTLALGAIGIGTAVLPSVAGAQSTDVTQIAQTGTVTTVAGSGVAGSADGTGTTAQFNGLLGLALDGFGNLYVGDTGNNAIRRILADGTVTTLAVAASLNQPRGVAVDVLGIATRCAALNDTVTLFLTILDHDDLRGALKPDSRGRSWRGDANALRRLLAETPAPD